MQKQGQYWMQINIMESKFVQSHPSLSISEAETLAQDTFDIDGRATPLPSYRDQNFRIQTSDGLRAVLKVSNAEDSAAMLDCQSEMMRTLTEAGLPVPSVMGQTTIQSAGQTHHVRLVSWLEGTPLALANPITPVMERACGALLGRMDTALMDFQHEGAEYYSEWDLAHAETTITEHMEGLSAEDRLLIENVLDLYRHAVAPVWKDLPLAVIHNDANDYNFMVGSALNDLISISGLLDFSSVVHTARVCNAAICGAYLALYRADPMDALVEVVRGYYRECPLSEKELEVFFALACTRLAVSVCLSAAQYRLEPENDYLTVSAAAAWTCLRKFSEVHPNLAHYRIRDAAG
jgi:Ser/Thr protein kinase RdoA (MazF antagonist)